MDVSGSDRSGVRGGVVVGQLHKDGLEALLIRADDAADPQLTKGIDRGLIGGGGTRPRGGGGGGSDEPVGTRREGRRVVRGERGKGKEGRGDLVADEKAGRVEGIGEELPYGLGQHGERGGAEVHEAETTRGAREEGNVLARKEDVGVGRGLFGALSSRGEPVDSTLHGKEMAEEIGRIESQLVDHLSCQTLVGGVDAAEKARV